MTPISSTHIKTTDVLSITLQNKKAELLDLTTLQIQNYIRGKYWYSACSLAAALPDENFRQKMGYHIITSFLVLPIIDDFCLHCKWRMSCTTCDSWAKLFFKKLSDIAFQTIPKPKCDIDTLACIQMTASIWPDTSSHWVYIAFQKSIDSQLIVYGVSLAMYLKNETVLRFMNYSSMLISDLVRNGEWNIARRFESITTACAMAKGLPFRSPLLNMKITDKSS